MQPVSSQSWGEEGLFLGAADITLFVKLKSAAGRVSQGPPALTTLLTLRCGESQLD